METKHPQFIMPGSFDPMHNSHFATFMKAKKKYPELCILICQNENKEKGLFSLEERAELARIYLPSEHILIAHSNTEIFEYASRAEKIIRGYRNKDEIVELRNTAIKHGVMEFKDKLELFKIPSEFCIVSSSRLKSLIERHQPVQYLDWTKPEIMQKLREKFERT